MEGDDIEWFWSGLTWGMVLIILLIRFEMWLRRPPVQTPVDPFDTLRWEVLHSARNVIDGEVIHDATG
jgi:hypothetical protein